MAKIAFFTMPAADQKGRRFGGFDFWFVKTFLSECHLQVIRKHRMRY